MAVVAVAVMLVGKRKNDEGLIGSIYNNNRKIPICVSR